MAHGDARDGNWRGNWRMEWVTSTLTLPQNVVYPALLTLMRTPRLPAVDWTDALANLNGLVRFSERRNLVSAPVPSHFKRTISTAIRGHCAEFSGHGNFAPGICIPHRRFWARSLFILSSKIVQFTAQRAMAYVYRHCENKIENRLKTHKTDRKIFEDNSPIYFSRELNVGWYDVGLCARQIRCGLQLMLPWTYLELGSLFPWFIRDADVPRSLPWTILMQFLVALSKRETPRCYQAMMFALKIRTWVVQQL